MFAVIYLQEAWSSFYVVQPRIFFFVEIKEYVQIAKPYTVSIDHHPKFVIFVGHDSW